MSSEDKGIQKGNREYKDSIFRDLFGAPERKANALALYNALNGSNYTDPDVLEVTTIEGVLFASVRNDVSYLIDGNLEMALWEHQSTPNPNMPLRGLVYFAHLYSAYVERSKQDLYSASLVTVPKPSYVVFYNGKEQRPERYTLRLSNAYDGDGCIEVVAAVVNINAGHNPELMEACAALKGYARFVELAREYHEVQKLPLEEAFDRAATQCMKEGLLVDYLSTRWKERREMFKFGHTFEELEQLRDEANQRAKEANERAEDANQRIESLAAEIEKQKAEAEKQKAEAEKQKAEAEKQKAEAEKQKAEAEKQKAESVKRVAALVASGQFSVEVAADVLGVSVDEARERMGL